MSYDLLDSIRRIPAERLDFESKCGDVLISETFTEADRLLKEAIEQKRQLVHAGRTAGLDTKALVALYEADDFALPETANRAFIAGYFAAAERGIRIGKIAAEQLIFDARSYSQNMLDISAPWLRNVEAVDDE